MMARSVAGDSDGPQRMKRPLRKLTAATLPAALVLALPAGAEAATAIAPARAFVPHQLVVKFEGQRSGRVLPLPAGTGVHEAVAALSRNPRIAYAAPNFIATASARSSQSVVEIPNDPGELSATPAVPGAWVTKQWNFLPWQE